MNFVTAVRKQVGVDAFQQRRSAHRFGSSWRVVETGGCRAVVSRSHMPVNVCFVETP